MSMSDDDVDDVDNGVVGNQNAERLEHVEQIADSADANRPDELEPVDEDMIDGSTIEEREAAAAKWNAEESARHQAQLEEIDRQTRTFRLKVDGREEVVTEAELLRRAQMNTAADRKFAQAAEARRQLEAERQQLEQERLQAEQDRRQADELLASAQRHAQDDPDEVFARQLQEMPPGEAAKLLKQLRAELVPKPQIEQIQAKVRADLEFEQASEYAVATYPDIFRDEMARAAFFQLDQQAVENGNKTRQYEPYKARYDRLAGLVRQRMGTIKTMADKQERKRQTLSSIPMASTKVLPPANDEEDDSPAAIIEQMARARGQTHAQR
jgi:hypothetical protein